jgi:hypothetical protein
MNITFAEYYIPSDMDRPSMVKCTAEGQTIYIPLDPNNADYQEIMRQVEAGELTIQDAE